jgi:cobyrinic acid a,c-diamide synthase
MRLKTPRIVIAGLSGDSGKTMVSLCVLAALRRKGLNPVPFKKGPDYIDPAWLGLVAGTAARNLDTYLVEAEMVRRNFMTHAAQADIAIIEGNRGLFDGKDLYGTHSTAGLARLLQAPLVLVVDVTKATRTVAALVKGCQAFEPDVPLAGVVLTKVAGSRHESVIREAIEQACELPVLGAIPKLGADADLLPGRHLGLVPPTEHGTHTEVLNRLEEIADRYLDFDRLIAVARSAGELSSPDREEQTPTTSPVRIGYFSDAVFTFYYPENLEALGRRGADMVPVSSLADSQLPEIDALYIGGGFPETHAERLADNRSLMASVAAAAEGGLPIYAECGGLIYLCRSLQWKDTLYPMAGVFPLDLEMHVKPVGHGYMKAAVTTANPYFEVGQTLTGHEFHYSGLVSPPAELPSCLQVTTGTGLGGGRDGLVTGRTMACYMHIHADGCPEWAEGLVANAARYAAERRGGSAGGSAGTIFSGAAI